MNENSDKLEQKQINIGSSTKDYQVLQELGRGSYGTVYKVLEIKLNKEVVMKKINIKHMKPKQQKEALKEAQILRKIKNNSIIKYYTSFMEGECLYIIMEYADGGDLQQLIKEKKSKKQHFREDQIWDFAWSLINAIDYLHNNNIMHRDIKTLNIFLTKDKKIKIGDLGVSKIVQTQMAMQATVVGTPLYLAPELVKHQPYDFKVDIWAIGCVLYHICALEPPFQGENLITLGFNIVNKNPKPLPGLYSAKLMNIINFLLQKNPAKRPSAREAIEKFPNGRISSLPSQNNNDELSEKQKVLQANNQKQIIQQYGSNNNYNPKEQIKIHDADKVKLLSENGDQIVRSEKPGYLDDQNGFQKRVQKLYQNAGNKQTYQPQNVPNRKIKNEYNDVAVKVKENNFMHDMFDKFADIQSFNGKQNLSKKANNEKTGTEEKQNIDNLGEKLEKEYKETKEKIIQENRNRIKQIKNQKENIKISQHQRPFSSKQPLKSDNFMFSGERNQDTYNNSNNIEKDKSNTNSKKQNQLTNSNNKNYKENEDQNEDKDNTTGYKKIKVKSPRHRNSSDYKNPDKIIQNNKNNDQNNDDSSTIDIKKQDQQGTDQNNNNSSQNNANTNKIETAIISKKSEQTPFNFNKNKQQEMKPYSRKLESANNDNKNKGESKLDEYFKNQQIMKEQLQQNYDPITSQNQITGQAQKQNFKIRPFSAQYKKSSNFTGASEIDKIEKKQKEIQKIESLVQNFRKVNEEYLQSSRQPKTKSSINIDELLSQNEKKRPKVMSKHENQQNINRDVLEAKPSVSNFERQFEIKQKQKQQLKQNQNTSQNADNTSELKENFYYKQRQNVPMFTKNHDYYQVQNHYNSNNKINNKNITNKSIGNIHSRTEIGFFQNQINQQSQNYLQNQQQQSSQNTYKQKEASPQKYHQQNHNGNLNVLRPKSAVQYNYMKKFQNKQLNMNTHQNLNSNGEQSTKKIVTNYLKHSLGKMTLHYENQKGQEIMNDYNNKKIVIKSRMVEPVKEELDDKSNNSKNTNNTKNKEQVTNKNKTDDNDLVFHSKYTSPKNPYQNNYFSKETKEEQLLKKYKAHNKPITRPQTAGFQSTNMPKKLTQYM